jgi:hypothetical protein
VKERVLYVALALVYHVPVWAVGYLPTTDGPAHTYNAWVLRQLRGSEPSWLDRYYEVDAQPLPNWLGHAVMAGLMGVVPPGDFDPGAWRDEIDAIYCWKMRPEAPIARRIEQHYVLVAERGPARVYARAPLED